MKDISLSLYSNKDLPFFQKWLCNKSLMSLMDMGPFTNEEIRNWPTQNKVTLIVKNENGTTIGFSNFYNFSEDKKIAKHGTLIDPQFQNNGYGKLALTKSIKYGFKFLNLKRIEVYVKDSNPISKKNVEACGFEFDYYDKLKGRYYYHIFE